MPDASIMEGLTNVWGHKEFDLFGNDTGVRTGKVDPDVAFMVGLYDRLMEVYAQAQQISNASNSQTLVGTPTESQTATILDAPVVSTLADLPPPIAVGAATVSDALPQVYGTSDVKFEVIPYAREQLAMQSPQLNPQQRDFLATALEAGAQLSQEGLVVHPAVMAGQAAIESAYGTSDLAVNANNPLGMIDQHVVW